ncbi:Tetracenomycin-F1 monooxygenase [Actinomadura rubteroloni]|uniref:Tetracenomycin-F1 monooxygenase n=1 Tax=Actinomadura rubteroloni TaxID=1926885 RepID=A0A2P4UGT9_9ACTN|nr:antibiotic biosynthesis monooxygenase family protein [Actinomadura rubteroloni]POM24261.1 Tetracenomycin-F1 monooxygenase [Actinomadura rubteroloni]
MTTIQKDSGLTTMINVFTTTPDKQQALLDVLLRATEDHIAKMPGFHSANFHASADGLRVVNYAQWTTPDAWKAMLTDPQCRVHIEKARELAEHDDHLYEVVAVHEAAR